LERLDFLDRLRDFPPVKPNIPKKPGLGDADISGLTFCSDEITLSTHAFHCVKLLGSLGSTVGAGIIL